MFCFLPLPALAWLSMSCVGNAVRLPEPEAAAQDPMNDLLREMAVGGADFWRRRCPWLHVEDEGMRALARNSVFPYSEGDPDLADAADSWSQDLVSEGYFIAGPEELPPWAVDVGAVARGVEALVAEGLPPMFILAFDEPWVLAAQLGQLIRVSSGGNEPIMDWAAFYVRARAADAVGVTEGSAGPDAAATPAAAPAGWPPHRDRGTDDAALTGFRADGSPRYTTVWVALTDATPQSSCLMCVPRSKDPGYSQGDRGVSPLTAIFKTPEAFQHIRALPVRAGGIVAFSHRLLHWGSAAGPRAAAARISVAFAAADASFTEPYFPRSFLPLPPLRMRLALVAGQALAYVQNEQMVTTPARSEAFWDLFRGQASDFNPKFQRLVAEHRAYMMATLRPDGSRDADGAAPAASVSVTSAETPAVEHEEEAMEGSVQDLFAGI